MSASMFHRHADAAIDDVLTAHPPTFTGSYR